MIFSPSLLWRSEPQNDYETWKQSATYEQKLDWETEESEMCHLIVAIAWNLKA